MKNSLKVKSREKNCCYSFFTNKVIIDFFINWLIIVSTVEICFRFSKKCFFLVFYSRISGDIYSKCSYNLQGILKGSRQELFIKFHNFYKIVNDFKCPRKLTTTL